jgi:hypothetical protein
MPFLILLAAFYILFNIPGYHWYYAPFVFFLTIFAFGLIPSTRSASFATLIVLMALTGASFRYLRSVAVPAVSYRDAGAWLNEHTPPNATIASVETGTIGWYCDRNLIDIVGLTTPQNAHYTAKADFTSWFAEKPDYIVVHPTDPFTWELVALHSPQYKFVPVHFDNVYILQRK